MTPRQRRLHRAAIEQAAAAPCKSWLGMFRPLTSIQSAWVKALLSVWGEANGGRTSEEAMLDGYGFWICLRAEEWTDAEAKRITETIKGLRKIGYTGEALLKMAKGILWPKKSLRDLLNRQIQTDESDFVEKSILAALEPDDPVYVVGIDFYARRKRVSDIARYLMEVAPWLTKKQAEDRVRWCISHFNSVVYLSMRAQLGSSVKNDTL